MNADSITYLRPAERGSVVRSVDSLDVKLGGWCAGALRGHCECWSKELREREEKKGECDERELEQTSNLERHCTMGDWEDW